MKHLPALVNRLPAALSALLSALLLTSCSARNNNGQVTIAGIIYVILAIYALISLLKQDWSLGKKLVWGVIIWVFPVFGSIIYLLFSGRQK